MNIWLSLSHCKWSQSIVLWLKSQQIRSFLYLRPACPITLCNSTSFTTDAEVLWWQTPIIGLFLVLVSSHHTDSEFGTFVKSSTTMVLWSTFTYNIHPPPLENNLSLLDRLKLFAFNFTSLIESWAHDCDIIITSGLYSNTYSSSSLILFTILLAFARNQSNLHILFVLESVSDDTEKKVGLKIFVWASILCSFDVEIFLHY